MKYDTIFDYRRDNFFSEDDFKILISKNTCYDSIYFFHEKSLNTKSNIYSAIHQVHHEGEPAHHYFTVYLRQKNLPQHLWNRALIVRQQKNGEIEAYNSSWEGEFLKASSRDFGKYFITVDTIPPEISALNIFDKKNLAAQNTIQLKVRDDISGLKKYHPTVDGKWILMEYDEKNDLLTYFFDEHVQTGDHIFELTAEDEIGNISNFKISFKR